MTEEQLVNGKILSYKLAFVNDLQNKINAAIVKSLRDDSSHAVIFNWDEQKRMLDEIDGVTSRWINEAKDKLQKQFDAL